MKIELVVLDMAGTTVNDEDGVNRAVREALANVGIMVSPDAVNQVMGIPKPVALRQLIEASPHPERLAELQTIYADFIARMIRFYQTDPSVHEIPGAGAAFAKLRKAGIKVALDTGFSREIVDVVLERLGWQPGGAIDAAIASDEVPRGRPHPDMIHKLMQDLGITDASRVVKVGDTPSDLEEGTNAGCGMNVGVTQGSHTAAQMAECKHTHLIGTVAELPALLGL